MIRLRELSVLLVLLSIPILASCAGEMTAYPSDVRDEVKDMLDSTEGLLKDEQKKAIRNYFSNQYYGGYNEIQDRIEDTWKREQLINLEFIVNRILESDGLYNVQVRWHKSFLDDRGRPNKSTGHSEILLKPAGDSFRIINITGDHFF